MSGALGGVPAADASALGTALANATDGNGTLPLDMQFNQGHVVAIVFYPILMVISAVGNITVLVILLRRRKRNRSRINSMLMHLSIADLLVTFLMMPMEIAWNYTVSWEGGDALCRIMSFNRIFGLYLSSFVLVCISIDRYFAVLRPMQINDRRGRWMLVGAWIAAFVCSLPQVVVFQTLTHPDFSWYVQCITKGTLTTHTAEVAYAAFGMVATYCVPLSVIIFSYASIIVEIYRRSRDPVDDRLRRSSLGFLGRAKARTLKMTIIIVLVFFVCSTPYYVMMVWYWVDIEAVTHVDPRVQKGLLLFCSANSCMNPIVYGAFNIRTRRSASQRQRPKNVRQRALALLRFTSCRREREDCGGLGARDATDAADAAPPSAGSSSEHGAHAAGHRGSRGSQGSEVSIPLSALTPANAAGRSKLTLKSALKTGSTASPCASSASSASSASNGCKGARSPQHPPGPQQAAQAGGQRTIVFVSPNGAAPPLASPLAAMGLDLPLAVCSSCGESLRARPVRTLACVPDVTAVAVAREQLHLNR